MNKLQVICTAFLTVSAGTVIFSCSNNRSTGIEYARNMYDPIAYNPDQPNKNFKNGMTAQQPPAGTIPMGFDKSEEFPNTAEGYQAASTSMSNPLPVNVETLSQGKTLYLNMCSHCHGNEGKGDGSIVKMGKFPAPPAYGTGNSSRGGSMRDLTDGKIYHTITHGLNLMGPHKSQLTPEQRWKIVMYVHELQKLQ